MAHGLLESITLHVALINKNLVVLRAFVFLCSALSLTCINGCAAPLAVLSSTGTAAASSVGTAAVANPGTTVSLASSAVTGKSPLEHAASAATKKECSFFNVLDSKPICIEVVLPTITDNSLPLLGPADLPQKSSPQ